MTLPRQEQRATLRAQQLLVDLLTYPRVPKEVREQAKCILRHLPVASEEERLSQAVYPLKTNAVWRPGLRVWYVGDDTEVEKQIVARVERQSEGTVVLHFNGGKRVKSIDAMIACLSKAEAQASRRLTQPKESPDAP